MGEIKILNSYPALACAYLVAIEIDCYKVKSYAQIYTVFVYAHVYSCARVCVFVCMYMHECTYMNVCVHVYSIRVCVSGYVCFLYRNTVVLNYIALPKCLV
jgi:hypothetical protein